MEAAESLGAGSEEWVLAHEALSKLRLKRAALDAERLFGLSRRTTEEKLRVAGALEALPELAEALRSGKLNWSVVRELSRVAVPETEHVWIRTVKRKTAREVERMVSGLAPGDKPTDRRRPESVRHILRFEVGAETLATFREAMRELRKRSDHRLDDDAALLLIAREVLGGPGDAGRASYQVVVTHCEDCGRGFQHANGDLIELDRAIVEMCHCDAQNLQIALPNSVSVITDAPDVPTANAGKLAQARAPLGVTGELADAGTELARDDAHAGVTDELAHAHAGVTGELADAGTGSTRRRRHSRRGQRLGGKCSGAIEGGVWFRGAEMPLMSICITWSCARKVAAMIRTIWCCCVARTTPQCTAAGCALKGRFRPVCG
jgi:hypothetical protein